MPVRRFAYFLILALLLAVCAACEPWDSLIRLARSAPPTEQAVQRLVPQVIATYPHDATAFTEGLVYVDGVLYESAGRYGASSLREVALESGEIIQSTTLPSAYFGEGIAVIDDHIWMWTWRESTGFVFDRATLTPQAAFSFTGEGWGMCYDGDHLFTSDGSSQITIRSAETFTPLDTLPVTLDGEPVVQLNELECVGDSVYANVWYSDDIMQIDKTSGRVTAVIDASGLIPASERAAWGSEAVLNGIAYNAAADTFLLTGKLWDRLLEVQFCTTSTPQVCRGA